MKGNEVMAASLMCINKHLHIIVFYKSVVNLCIIYYLEIWERLHGYMDKLATKDGSINSQPFVPLSSLMCFSSPPYASSSRRRFSSFFSRVRRGLLRRPCVALYRSGRFNACVVARFPVPVGEWRLLMRRYRLDRPGHCTSN